MLSSRQKGPWRRAEDEEKEQAFLFSSRYLEAPAEATGAAAFRSQWSQACSAGLCPGTCVCDHAAWDGPAPGGLAGAFGNLMRGEGPYDSRAG